MAGADQPWSPYPNPPENPVKDKTEPRPRFVAQGGGPVNDRGFACRGFADSLQARSNAQAARLRRPVANFGVAHSPWVAMGASTVLQSPEGVASQSEIEPTVACIRRGAPRIPTRSTGACMRRAAAGGAGGEAPRKVKHWARRPTARPLMHPVAIDAALFLIEPVSRGSSQR